MKVISKQQWCRLYLRLQQADTNWGKCQLGLCWQYVQQLNQQNG